jgi:hypothetical protein
MYKSIVFLAAFCCISAHAEWYQVKSVESYNRIVAFKPNEPANEIKIRIKNLENIEDIQMGRSKVLLSGKSAQDLAKDTLRGQLVWIENLVEDSGIYVGNVFPSYEQVVRGFANQRMVGGQTISPGIKTQIQEIYKRMLRHLDSPGVFEDEKVIDEANQKAAAGQSVFSCEDCYEYDYLKGIFVYEALNWFKEIGQFLSPDVQTMYISWLAQYQTATLQRAKGFEQKIRGIVVRYELYKDFIFDN